VSSRLLGTISANTSFQTAWATVIHESHEGGGMKLRDLARSSGDSKSFMPAFHLFLSRFGSQETSRRSRKSYESVPRSSPTLRLLTLVQQAAMVPVLRFLHCPRYPGSPVTFPVRTHNRHQNLHPRTCRRPTSFPHFLIFEQNQREVYREVLIAGDLSREDLDASGRLWGRAVSGL